MAVQNKFVDIYRTCNNGTNQEKYALIKSGELQLPRYIDVELTNMCNFQCHFCPTGTKSMQRTKGFMPDKVVDAIVENVAAQIQALVSMPLDSIKFSFQGADAESYGEMRQGGNYIKLLETVRAMYIAARAGGGITFRTYKSQRL